jgi:hypothetical protein
MPFLGGTVLRVIKNDTQEAKTSCACVVRLNEEPQNLKNAIMKRN